MKSKLKTFLSIFLTALLLLNVSTAHSLDKKDKMGFATFTFSDAESCDDDCSYFAQNDFANNMADYEVSLAECLDSVGDTVVTAWLGSVAPGIPEWTNFMTVYDVFVHDYPDAMSCLSDSESTYNDSMDSSADNWEDCSNGCSTN